MIEQAMRDRYFELVKAYIARQEEQQLARAAQLGRDFAGAGILPNAIIELHDAALRRLAEEAPGSMLLAAVLPASALVTEVFTAYSLALHERDDPLQEETSACEKAEERLRESEERYRTLFEQSRDAIYLSPREGRFITAKKSMLDLFGHSGEETLELDVRRIYADSADRDTFQREIEEKGSVKDYEVRFLKKDGTQIDCLLTATARRADDGSILGYQGIIRDVTEQKKAEQALRASEQFSSSPISNAPIPLLVANPDSSLRYVNPALTQLTGFSPSELLGKKAPYPWWTEETLEEINGGRGTKYAGRVADTMLEAIEGGALEASQTKQGNRNEAAGTWWRPTYDREAAYPGAGRRPQAGQDTGGYPGAEGLPGRARLLRTAGLGEGETDSVRPFPHRHKNAGNERRGGAQRDQGEILPAAGDTGHGLPPGDERSHTGCPGDRRLYLPVQAPPNRRTAPGPGRAAQAGPEPHTGAADGEGLTGAPSLSVIASRRRGNLRDAR